MDKETKLKFHLEMIIWKDIVHDVRLSAKQVEALIEKATPDQKRRAYERALTHSPTLLPEEK